MPHKQQRKKNTLGKVPSDYTKKIGAGLYENQNAYFAHFQKRPSIFSYFSHNIQQVPMGLYHQKIKENKLQHSTSCNHFEFLSKLVFGKDGGKEILQGNDNNSNVAQRIVGILQTFRAQHPFPELTNEAGIGLGR